MATKRKNELTHIKNKFSIREKDIVLTDNLEMNEIMLQNYCFEIRRKWLQSVCFISSEFCKSPWRGMQPRDMEGKDVKYTYGTLVDDSKVSSNLEGYPVKNRVSQTYLYTMEWLR